MEVISTISIKKPNGVGNIQLLQGDLSSVPEEFKADILVVSAFPNQYQPLDGTLIGSLAAKGLSVAHLAENKETDLRAQLGCWLSKPLDADLQKQLHFKRVLCFEPLSQSSAPHEIVGNVFRCINTFAFDGEHNIVAMPVLAAGNQKVPMQKMLPALVEAAIFWLKQGLPLNCIRLVIFNKENVDAAQVVFQEIKETESRISKAQVETDPDTKIEVKASRGAGMLSEKNDDAQNKNYSYDFFVSYAHSHTSLVNDFVRTLLEKHTTLKIFYDRESIPPGGLWLKQISDAIADAKKVLIFLSPDYSVSPVCWDEFQCAKLVEYNNQRQMIQTIYLYNDKAMPPIMGIHSWIDCREGDVQKLNDSILQIVK
ncbi:MAG: toll/interleukin-1 receptor domain-containing protein [Flavisolibacter sp.]